jgi:pectinesterase
MGEITITVAPSGADYSTVQAAIGAVPANNTERYIIDIAPGTYTEQLTVPSNKPYITFRGQDANTTVLTYNLNANSIDANGNTVGTTGSTSTSIKGNDFIAENVTFANSTPNNVAQAVAIKTEADRLIFKNCRFLGWQDTLYANRGNGTGRQYYQDCTIEGDVDFIFGNGKAYFENCEIVTKEKGHATAQSKDSATLDSGYVFHNCRLTRPSATATPNNSSDLGRPWRAYATVIYDSCWMDAHIKAAGWTRWNDTFDANTNTSTAYYAEYNSTGPGANPAGRVAWSHQLTAEEVQAYSLANWLSGSDGWDPTIPEPATASVLGLGAATLLGRGQKPR